ncbi:MAG: hypothetical protein EAZ57_00385 [Cytophagales bacterium]|nr:MAG: hypothetical protein EAZ67_00745 [Cytophagales bacterium]TAF62251.1 MAG: hypothetical protein EAZ57_00385 [Cytophagales bacterium]
MLKPLACLALFFTLFGGLYAQSVVRNLIHPIVAKKSSDVLEITQLKCYTDKTVIDLELTCLDANGMFVYPADSLGAFCLIQKVKVLPLRYTQKVPSSGIIACQEGEVVCQFSLIFDALEQDVSTGLILQAQTEDQVTTFNNILLLRFEEAEKLAKSGDTLCQYTLAHYFQRESDYPKSEFFFELYLNSLNKLYGSKDVRYLSVTQEIIKSYLYRGEIEKAENLCLSLMQGLSDQHKSTPEFHNLLGDIFQAKGAHHEAIEQYIKYLRLLERTDVVKSSLYMTITNLIQYSYGQLANQDPLAAKPLWVGVALNRKQLVQNIAMMKIFAVGADEMIISQNSDFVDSDWQPYAVKEVLPFAPGVKRLFLRFRSSGALSEPIEILLTSTP